MELESLYGKNINIKEKEKRINYVKDYFIKNEKTEPEYIFSSPGRAEICGNHTDHNHGKVIVASISCDILAAVKKTDDNIIKVVSEGFEPDYVDLNDLKVNKKEYGKSSSLIKGVAKAIIDKGYTIHGFTAYTISNIFKGAGVSSSAAFEVLICEILNVLYLNNALKPFEKAVISQYAENVYFGKPCGLLDQSGIAIGSLTKLDFKNPESPIIKKLQIPKNYTLVITNTGGDHANLTEHYAAIKQEMIQIANYFGKQVLREVEEKEFYAHLSDLKIHFSDRAILRAIHFYNENKRVDIAEKSLVFNDIDAFLKCINESGLSSLNLLQNCYVPGEVKQPVVLGIEYSRHIIKNGAVRIHGGGFAGSIIAIVSNDEANNYANNMKKLFGQENVFMANIRPLGTTLAYEI